MSRLRTGLGIGQAVLRAAQQAQVPFLAAAVAFYGFVSVIPLALLGVATVQYLDIGVEETIVAQAGTFLSPSALDIVSQAAMSSAGRGGATAIGLAFLAWSGIRVFRGLDIAFSQVYGLGTPESLPDQLLDAVIVLGAIPVAILAAAVLGVVLPLFESVPFVGVASRLGLVGVLFVAFFPVYYRFPDVAVSPREVVPGTALAALGWAGLAAGFSLYAETVGSYHLYGILGAGLLLVTWMYLGGSIIMVGAVLNAVLAGRPDDGTERTDGVDRIEGSERTDRTDRTAPEPAPDLGAVASEVRDLRADLDAKTVSRSRLEAELKQYVRRRLRRGKARGWGPYLVLLYGTAMTLGAFYWLSGGWAILAMIVVWLSTLGLYVLMVLVGAGISVAGVPGRVADRLRDRRS